jgi:hypothetical protein
MTASPLPPYGSTTSIFNRRSNFWHCLTDVAYSLGARGGAMLKRPANPAKIELAQRLLFHR